MVDPGDPAAGTPFPHPLAFKDGVFKLSLGLRAAAETEWFEEPAWFDHAMAERDRLLAEAPDVWFQAIDGSEAAGAETLALMVEHLPRVRPHRYRLEGRRMVDGLRGVAVDLDAPGRHPLDTAGRLVAEDLCLLQSDDEAAGAPYRLTAASLCFPSHWRLVDKLGLPLVAIHAPVPGYDQRLEKPMDRFFASLAVGRIAQRTNWALDDTGALNLEKNRVANRFRDDITRENAGTRLWLRMERQTLRRLPETRAILFGIHIHPYSLDTLIDTPEKARALAGTLETLDEGTRAYKGLERALPGLLAWLADRG